MIAVDGATTAFLLAEILEIGFLPGDTEWKDLPSSFELPPKQLDLRSVALCHSLVTHPSEDSGLEQF